MLTIYLILILVFYEYLKSNKDIHIALMDSLIFPNKEELLTIFVLACVFPLTFLYLIYLKQIKFKNMKKLIIRGGIIVILYLLTSYFVGNVINYYNQSVPIEMSFNRNLSNRGITVNLMKTQLKEQLSVAKINDSSYSGLVKIIAESRKDAPGLMWKWAQENNANLNYSEVGVLYQKLFDNVETLRNKLLATEQLLQQDVFEWDVLHKKFPSNIYLFYQKKQLKYNPIMSSASKIINDTGVDNTLNL